MIERKNLQVILFHQCLITTQSIACFCLFNIVAFCIKDNSERLAIAGVERALKLGKTGSANHYNFALLLVNHVGDLSTIAILRNEND